MLNILANRLYVGKFFEDPGMMEGQWIITTD